MTSTPRRRHRLRWLAIALAFVVVVPIAAASWVYSGRIESDALAYAPPADFAPSAPWEPLTYPAPLGPTPAWLRPGTGHTWLVMVHGKGGDPGQLSALASAGLALGMPAVTIAYRGDPGAPADPSGRYGFGPREAPDLAAAVAEVRRRGAEHVVLVGMSMGGAIVAAYLRGQHADGFVRAVVLDAPVTDFRETVEWGAREVTLPGGLSLPGPVTWGAEQLASARYGVDWAATDFNDDTGWASVPTLVLHGDADETVPVTSSRELAARDRQVRLIEFPGAAHVVTIEGHAPDSAWLGAVRDAYAAALR